MIYSKGYSDIIIRYIEFGGAAYFKVSPPWIKGYRPVATYIRIERR